MAFESFPEYCYVKVLDTGETAHGGGAVLPHDCQLAQVRIELVKVGAHTGTERLRAKIYHDSALTKLYAGAVSDWVYFDDFAEGVTNWRGRVPFTFSTTPHIADEQRYYVALETDGYTRNGTSFFVAPAYDWPLAINEKEDASFYSWAMEFVIYRKVRR